MSDERILLAHGSGGVMSQRLVVGLFQKYLRHPVLEQMLDAGVVEWTGNRLAMTTDSFVVDPIFFKGGNIGKLAICGTVNDLVVSGAQARYLSVGFIIEEGLPIRELEAILEAMAKTAQEAGVAIIAGDTKVVGRGQADKIFINTTGVGSMPEGVELSPARIQAGDKIIVSGTMGDHGLAIMAEREGLSFSTPVESDCAPMHRLAGAMVELGSAVRVMRDPTRGGLATTLNELAQQSGLGLLVREEDIPVSPAVSGGCSMLGVDPLYLANEGKIIVIVAPEKAEAALAALKGYPEGQEARIIGEVIQDPAETVLLETELGAKRILAMLEGEVLPRIC